MKGLWGKEGSTVLSVFIYTFMHIYTRTDVLKGCVRFLISGKDSGLRIPNGGRCHHPHLWCPNPWDASCFPLSPLLPKPEHAFACREKYFEPFFFPCKCKTWWTRSFDGEIFKFYSAFCELGSKLINSMLGQWGRIGMFFNQTEGKPNAKSCLLWVSLSWLKIHKCMVK